MSISYVVDTHALIWYLESNARLGSAAKATLDNPASNLVLPVIALAEAVHVVNKGRTRIPNALDLLNDVSSDPRFTIYPLTFEILQVSLQASAVPEIHDRLPLQTFHFPVQLCHFPV